ARAVSSAVAITAVFTAAFAQSESDDGSALTRKRYLPEYKACGRAELLDYIDTPKLRELYLAWCGENGFAPIAIGAAA
ncbi:MAG TPA: hypothetical protein VFO67_13050, partial [Gemmatimonadales bacterium]|nr:hypothetical protein [Gemmatimonadales bacterium]